MLIVLLPDPMPKRVPFTAAPNVLLPTTFRFLTVLFVAPSAPLLCSQMTAEEVPAFVLVIVMSRVAPAPPAEPSIVTRSAAFRRMRDVADEPVIRRTASGTRGTPVG